MVTRTRIDQAEDSSDMNLPVDFVIQDHTQTGAWEPDKSDLQTEDSAKPENRGLSPVS